MIPINDIAAENLYSQDDAQFLLGDGFTKDAAREAICEACRAGDLEAKRFRKRWWFTGREFLVWVSGWFGEDLVEAEGGRRALAPVPLSSEHDAYRLGAPSSASGREVGT